MDNQNHCMSIKQARLIVNSHKHILLNCFLVYYGFLVKFCRIGEYISLDLSYVKIINNYVKILVIMLTKLQSCALYASFRHTIKNVIQKDIHYLQLCRHNCSSVNLITMMSF